LIDLIISVDIQMGAKIPRPIKLEVIPKWLQGKSRDQIAREVGIGAGIVSGIINECRQNGGEDLDQIEKIESLIISLEVFCFKQGLSVKGFFDQVRELYWAAALTRRISRLYQTTRKQYKYADRRNKATKAGKAKCAK
jgi:hypothetical protein